MTRRVPIPELDSWTESQTIEAERARTRWIARVKALQNPGSRVMPKCSSCSREVSAQSHGTVLRDGSLRCGSCSRRMR